MHNFNRGGISPVLTLFNFVVSHSCTCLLYTSMVGNMSYEQLISKIKEFIPRQDKDVIKVIENPQTYTKEDRWLKHYLTTADGISFVITNQWRKEYIPMVKALADNLGIEFEQI